MSGISLQRLVIAGKDCVSSVFGGSSGLGLPFDTLSPTAALVTLNLFMELLILAQVLLREIRD